ncbi:MAG: hypothetical protein R3C56_04190 [Pirellulaceae bacterium]
MAATVRVCKFPPAAIHIAVGHTQSGADRAAWHHRFSRCVEAESTPSRSDANSEAWQTQWDVRCTQLRDGRDWGRSTR